MCLIYATLILKHNNSSSTGIIPTKKAPDPGKAISYIIKRLKADPSGLIDKWKEENRRGANNFWSKSAISISDPLIENLWYETLHAKRCIYRPDTVPPGLALPSTVLDYSLWHGDYHTNYNIQSPFFGDYTSNHPELGDAYFQAIKYFIPPGKNIAKKYYGCRGVFIQLCCYPILTTEDPYGTGPFSRMAYMTGWIANQYWWRYLYTMDKRWLSETGYPLIRDCALFYTDFIKKGSDGLYHAFPSNMGEEDWSGNPADYTDTPQVMQHIRYCLRASVEAARILGVDKELCEEWEDRLDKCAGDGGKPPYRPGGKEKNIYEKCAPEFSPHYPWSFNRWPGTWPAYENMHYNWYFGNYPWQATRRVRSGKFKIPRDFQRFREVILRWRRPNGILRAMSSSVYGHYGAYTESLGVNGPLQDMMLQSWEGFIKIFPAWPDGVDAGFKKFRAEGAFLVSASISAGTVKNVEITSEKNNCCRFKNPWSPGRIKVINSSNNELELSEQAGDIISFRTEKGKTYFPEPV